MPLQIITLENKQPWEIVPYVFDFSKWVQSTDPISACAFGIYVYPGNPVSPTLIPTMVYATDFGDTWISCDVGSGTDTEATYVIRARATTTAGRRFEQEGIFEVAEI